MYFIMQNSRCLKEAFDCCRDDYFSIFLSNRKTCPDIANYELYSEGKSVTCRFLGDDNKP